MNPNETCRSTNLGPGLSYNTQLHSYSLPPSTNHCAADVGKASNTNISELSIALKNKPLHHGRRFNIEYGRMTLPSLLSLCSEQDDFVQYWDKNSDPGG